MSMSDVEILQNRVDGLRQEITYMHERIKMLTMRVSQSDDELRTAHEALTKIHNQLVFGVNSLHDISEILRDYRQKSQKIQQEKYDGQT